MARAIVRLYCAQYADVEVNAPLDASLGELRELALRGLDDSGGAEWWTEAGWVEFVTWNDDDASIS